jgi:peroxiredoxin
MRVDTKIEKTGHESLTSKSYWLWSTLIGLVLVVGGMWIIYSRTIVSGRVAGSDDAISLEPAPVAGHPAPDFELKNLDGELIRLTDFKGTPVIVNFWATWCPPCRAEFPDFQKAAVEHSGELVIIGVNHTTSDTPALIPGFVEEFGITFPIVLDETGETVKTYRVMGLPTSVFIDRDGIINEVFTGPINKAYIEAKLSEL